MCFLSSLEKLEGNIGVGGGGESQQAEPSERDQEACTSKTGVKGVCNPR